MQEMPPSIEPSAVLKRLVSRSICPDDATYKRFLERVEQGALTRDESPSSHFCTYFLPVDQASKRVFIVHHKKSGLWLSPGEHIDRGETPDQAVNREIAEELGVQKFYTQEPRPFFFSIVDIEGQKTPCQSHFDLWYRMETNGSDFHVDPSEFHQTKWMTVPEARGIIVDPSNLQALEIIEKLF